jgi:hypothetical protein
MIRENLQGDARHLFLAKTAQNGLVFLRRSESMGVTDQDADAPDMPQPWLKLVRRGHLFSSFISANGTDWQWVGTETVNLPDTVYFGYSRKIQLRY